MALLDTAGGGLRRWPQSSTHRSMLSAVRPARGLAKVRRYEHGDLRSGWHRKDAHAGRGGGLPQQLAVDGERGGVHRTEAVPLIKPAAVLHKPPADAACEGPVR